MSEERELAEAIFSQAVGQSGESAIVQERVVMWIGWQWKESLAKSIWDDMTPLGRLTIWLPIWILCWLSLPIILPICLISFFLVKIGDKPLSWLGKQFFN